MNDTKRKNTPRTYLEMKANARAAHAWLNTSHKLNQLTQKDLKPNIDVPVENDVKMEEVDE